MADSGKRPTVQDIAQTLSISPSTVYRVLNGSPLVKDETRRRIEQLAMELGYEKRHNRRHVPGSILVIALFLPRSGDVYHRLFYDPADLLAGLSEGFGSVKTQISVSVNDARPSLFEFKKSGNIDACVFGFTTPADDVRDLLKNRGIPAVVLNRETPGCNYVSADHLEGMRALLRRARERRGLLRPCYINFTPAQAVSKLRVRSFLTACEREGVPFSESHIFHIDSVEQIDAAMIARIVEEYNVAFCFNDFVAVYLYQIALITRIAVPEKLGIAGYDDSPVRQLTPQKIDTVSLSPFRLGQAAAQWLRSAIIEREWTPLHRLVPGEVIAGETLVPKRNS